MKLLVKSCGVFLALAMIGCGKGRSAGAGGDFRTDVAPIERRLANFPKIVSVKWKGRILDSEKLITVPGPSRYRIWGYAKFNKDALTELVKKSGDVGKKVLEEPDFSYVAKGENFQWRRSNALDEMAQQRRSAGSIWFCLDEGLIYFDLEGE
jgi:hypothetical protein